MTHLRLRPKTDFQLRAVVETASGEGIETPRVVCTCRDDHVGTGCASRGSD